MAKGLIREGFSTISEIANRFMSGTSSLTEYGKDAAVTIRTYIEDNLANEDVIDPLMGFLNQMCISYVMTALNLNQCIEGGKTVRDLLKIVAAENYVDSVEVISNNFGKKQENSIVDSLEAVKTVELDNKSQRLYCGRVIEIDFMVSTDASNKKEKIQILVYVQLIPHLLTSRVISGFVDANFKPPIDIRFKQVLAGEIKFIKDFLMAKDQIDKREKMLKEDKTGVLDEMFNKQNNSLGKYFGGLIGKNPKNQNLANSIIIIDKQTFKKVCNTNSLDFSDMSIRNDFFKKTFTMTLVVVDTMYSLVEVYLNGIRGKGEYTFNMLNKLAGGSKNDMDIKEIMTTLASGRPPRY